MKNKELLTVGELAKLMDTTVRTLQYYDKEGLLKPSHRSEGGRRLYTKKDMVQLHQILSLKYLGFSLEDIKNKLICIDNPDDVVEALNSKEEALKSQIEKLSEALSAVQSLRDEVLVIHEVDFNKYADIIALLRQKNDGYWVIKYFDNKLMTHIRDRFGERPEFGMSIFQKWKSMCDEVVLLKNQKETPEGNKGQELAKQWWSLVMDFTGGDMSMLPELMKFNNNKQAWTQEMKNKQLIADEFIGKALEIYFKNSGVKSTFSEEEFNELSNKS
ncbi:DNA-binding transcriptional regulator, MerR family [Clostridium acidisoli DSM 12555]|jgi:DNA-binding transcriptional MerR regulator|uniref:DNA-binding transcriptional regulator, MerR family n=1 Tax=Clostridium acidisoli DSM 12555 TaxID=1121291 RepID=A0A1W1WXJ5_9CLOT|nr:MerR family transcriptional regulator [Clostridium acidisoli]SMC16327.1 DNA-binding transcriptional regulator, MerR family [Clostridium acidisoli DSM 12555]